MNFFTSLGSNTPKETKKAASIATEIPKTKITLIYQDKDQTVTWFSDTPIADARFAVICACDSLVDGEFQALDDKANLVDFEKIENFRNNQIFFIRKLNSKPSQILLDSRRKLFVEIPALKHIETQTALKNMLLGANLLKHKKKSFPHLRLFQISTDLKRLFWYTKSKKIDVAQVVIDQISEITFGQSTGNFRVFPLKILEDFSFTLHYYKNKNYEKIETLELTCKDEREFDLWVIGIKALCAHNCGNLICKDALLSHSKSYLEQISKGNLSKCSSYLFYPPGRENANKSLESQSDNSNKDESYSNCKGNSDNSNNKFEPGKIDSKNYYAVNNPNLIDFSDNENYNKNNNNNLINFANNKEEVLDSERNWVPLSTQKGLLSNRENKALNDMQNNNNNNNSNNHNNNINHNNQNQRQSQNYATNKPKSLEQFIVARNLSKFQLAKLILKLASKFKNIREEVEFYSSHDDYKTGKAEENYDMIFSEEAIADDLDSQKGQMLNLYKESQINLTEIISEFLNSEFSKGKSKNLSEEKNNFYSNNNNKNNENSEDEEEAEAKDKFEKISLSGESDSEQDLDSENEIDGYKKVLAKLRVCLETFLDRYNNNSKESKLRYLSDIQEEKDFLREIDLKIWKIEIDLENICDILNRFNSNKDVGFVDKIKNVFKNFFK